ncbi:diguanylate cyclase domain-containing protein [Psychromonas ossibalaenae]|uniref:diguanylate cyclase domain-containing protein n=1 Tax=Psychromonas ossibalaenae TaxID=444922 RepID=UPI000363ADB4|nr:diguanylate cyclase [Psychromonas ossibalaenae]
MAENTQTEQMTSGAQSENQSDDLKGVVDIANYQQAEDKISSESAAFEQVMSQMNIADRRQFDEQYAKLWQEASEEKQLLSALICEIDFFEAYNENYGHQAAAFMLLVVGLAMKKICEDYDSFLARYEGNVFAILIKDSDASKAHAVAEALRLAVEKSRTEHKYSSVSDVVTLSVGLSTITPTSQKILVEGADTALSFAKISGRNQVSGPFGGQNDEPSQAEVTATTAKAEPKVEVELKSKTKVKSKAKPKGKVKVKAEPKVEPAIEPKVDDKPKTKARSKIDVSDIFEDKDPKQKDPTSFGFGSFFKPKPKPKAKAKPAAVKPVSDEASDYERLKAEYEQLKSESQTKPEPQPKPRSYY